MNINTNCKSSYFLKGIMKMDGIDPLGKHDKTDEQPETGETISLTQGGVTGGRSSWEPEREQETSFRGTSLRTKVLRECIEGLY